MGIELISPEGKEERIGFCIHHYENYRTFMTRQYNRIKTNRKKNRARNH